jgi:catalase
VGLNFPVFFVRDPMMVSQHIVYIELSTFLILTSTQGPDNIRSQQRNPKSGLVDHNAWFDFLANVPESNHAGMMLFSDHATPVGWRFMSAYGAHTFRWVNREGKYVFIKVRSCTVSYLTSENEKLSIMDLQYHWRSQQGTKQFTDDEAVMMCGRDPDYSKRDLYELLDKGGEASWTLLIQVMQPEEAASVSFISSTGRLGKI